MAGGHQMHHIIDPRSCTPAKVVWLTATVAAPNCVAANALSTSALILGHDAPAWLQEQGFAARLVSAAGEVVNVAGFPAITEESRNA
jgi:thiamine biosynthesis lipoprotein